MCCWNTDRDVNGFIGLMADSALLIRPFWRAMMRLGLAGLMEVT